MRASEASTKICPYSFGIAHQPGVSHGGPIKCATSECMAWRVYTEAGTLRYWSSNAPMWPGWEINPDAPVRPGNIAVRATEDHGECHALPRSEE